MSDFIKDDMPHFQVLDKDYGRTKGVGGGYGIVDEDQYRWLESLAEQS